MDSLMTNKDCRRFKLPDTGGFKALTEMNLLYTTTLVIYLVLENSSVLNKECDLRDYVKSMEPQYVLSCNDLPSEDVFYATINSLPVSNISESFDFASIWTTVLEDCRETATLSIVGYTLGLELVLISTLLYLYSEIIERQLETKQMVLERKFVYPYFYFFLEAQMSLLAAFGGAAVVNLVIIMFLKNIQSSGNFCMAPKGVEFALNSFAYFAVIFCVVAAIAMIPEILVLVHNKKVLNELLVEMKLTDFYKKKEFKNHRESLALSQDKFLVEMEKMGAYIATHRNKFGATKYHVVIPKVTSKLEDKKEENSIEMHQVV